MPAILARQAMPAYFASQIPRLLPYSIGASLNALFMGMVITQAFTYYRFVRTDSKLVLALVILAVCSAAGASVIVLLWQQDIFVWGFGNLLAIIVCKWYTRCISFNIATTLIVQAFYIDRSRKLFNHWWPVALIAPFAVGAFATQIAFVHVAYAQCNYLDPYMFSTPLPNTLANVYLTLTVVADILITVIVVYGLNRVKTGWKHTDVKLRRLIITCFEAQVPALIIAIIGLVCWRTQDPVIMSFIMITSNVYVLGMLITLNLRGSPSASAAGANVTYGSGTGVIPKQSHVNSYPLSSMPDLIKGGELSNSVEEQMPVRKPSWENDVSSAKSGHGETAIMDVTDSKYGSAERLTPTHRFIR